MTQLLKFAFSTMLALTVAVVITGCSKGNAATDALIESACNGDGAGCQRLIEAGLPVDAADSDGDTALDWAVFYCKIDVVKRLLDFGADVNHADGEGRTPLMFTATTLRGHFLRGTREERNEIAKLLIKHGADVNRAMGNGQASGDGQTALHFAACDKNAPLVRMLLAAGANKNARDTHGWTPLDMAKGPCPE